jgi:hypothetical protein
LADFGRATGLDKFCERHIENIRRGVRETDRILRVSTARDPRWYDEPPYEKLIKALADIVKYCPQVGSDFETAAVLLPLEIRSRTAYSSRFHTIHLRDKDRVLDDSLMLLNSRHPGPLIFGGIQISSPFIQGFETKLQRWISSLSEDIMRMDLLKRVEDPAILTHNRARYRAIGVVLALSLVGSLPVSLKIEPGLLEHLLRPSEVFIWEDESNWEIIAGGFHSIVDVELIGEFDTRFPGKLLTLLRGRVLDVDDFFRSVAIDGFTTDRLRLGVSRESMVRSRKLSRTLLNFLTGSNRVPVGGLGSLPYTVTIVDAGSIAALSKLINAAHLLVLRYKSYDSMLQDLRRCRKWPASRTVRRLLH